MLWGGVDFFYDVEVGNVGILFYGWLLGEYKINVMGMFSFRL